MISSKETKSAMATVGTALRMPSDLAARYKRLAKLTGRTKTFYMLEALSKSIDELEHKYGDLKTTEDLRTAEFEAKVLGRQARDTKQASVSSFGPGIRR